jgi:hypothetical protein
MRGRTVLAEKQESRVGRTKRDEKEARGKRARSEKKRTQGFRRGDDIIGRARRGMM